MNALLTLLANFCVDRLLDLAELFGPVIFRWFTEGGG